MLAAVTLVQRRGNELLLDVVIHHGRGQNLFFPGKQGAKLIVGVGENLVHIKLYVGQFCIAWDMKPVDVCNEEPFFLAVVWASTPSFCRMRVGASLCFVCSVHGVFHGGKLTNASSVSAAALGAYASLLLKSTLLDTI